jgi:hypothetical protein
MSSEMVACPYCNARVKVTAPMAPRVRCPRCEEVFPYRGGDSATEAVTNDPPPATAFATSSTGRAAELPRRRSNRVVVVALLLVMSTMATVGLVYAWWTRPDRRKRDPSEPTLVAVVAPAQLAALGYLPPDTDVIAGFHVAEALEVPVGRELLPRLRLPLADFGPDSLERWTGLKLEDIDHAVLGFKIEGRLIPRANLIVQARRPIDTKKVLAALKAGQPIKQDKKTVYQFEVSGFRPALWFTDDEYRLVVGLAPAELDPVPLTPNPRIDHLLPPLRTFLADRLGPGTQAWLVGHVSQFDKTALATALALLPPTALPEEERKILSQVRTMGIWLRLDKGLDLSGAFQCVDAASAPALDRYLARWGPDADTPLNFFGPRPEMRALSRQLSRTMKLEVQDSWVTLRSRATAEVIREALAPKEPEAGGK